MKIYIMIQITRYNHLVNYLFYIFLHTNQVDLRNKPLDKKGYTLLLLKAHYSPIQSLDYLNK